MSPSPVSLQDVANIITFIAPGYFAFQVYAIIYAKRERDFSKLFIESVIYSLPLVTLTNIIWQTFLGLPPVSALDISYAVLLFTVACAVGGLITLVRNRWPVVVIAERLGLGAPNEDFVKTQLVRLGLAADPKPLTITLRSGEVFSGTIYQMSRYAHGGQQYFYFNNLAWFDGDQNKWDKRDGGVIIERGEIEYIETAHLPDRQTKKTTTKARNITI